MSTSSIVRNRIADHVAKTIRDNLSRLTNEHLDLEGIQLNVLTHLRNLVDLKVILNHHNITVTADGTDICVQYDIVIPSDIHWIRTKIMLSEVAGIKELILIQYLENKSW